MATTVYRVAYVRPDSLSCFWQVDRVVVVVYNQAVRITALSGPRFDLLAPIYIAPQKLLTDT